mgnify:CR=1 FL=1
MEITVMNRERLIKNMTDQVKEAQLKLGYAPETVRLYYPVASLNEILGTAAQNAQEMLCLLNREFKAKTDLGELKFSSHARLREDLWTTTADMLNILKDLQVLKSRELTDFKFI